jgi:hypothetical protein
MPNDNELTGPPADGPKSEPRKPGQERERKAQAAGSELNERLGRRRPMDEPGRPDEHVRGRWAGEVHLDGLTEPFALQMGKSG